MRWEWGLYALLLGLLFARAKVCGKGQWNEEYTSLDQVGRLRGFMALGVALHHMSHKTCAHWLPQRYIVPGLEPFVDMGYMLVGVFLFCSGLGLYKSFRGKPGYLKGFFRRRILPVAVGFWLSEALFLLARLAVGESMNAGKVILYLTGLSLANYNGWYAVAIPFFYLAFWAAFRFCRREGAAIGWVTAFALGYALLCACVDHGSPTWFGGEWWYNSAVLFPLGILFGKYESRVTAFFRRGYWLYLAAALAGHFALVWLAGQATNVWWGYYGENWGDPYKVIHRLGSAAAQWLVAADFAAFWFLLMMKVRLRGKILAFMGGLLLEFYLVHGLFVQLFGYNFLDVGPSIVYIRNMPLYVLAVLGASVPTALLLKHLRLWILALPGRKIGRKDMAAGA